MSKRPPRSKLYEWRITRIRAHTSRPGRIRRGPDAEQAVKEAIATYGITNPHEQARLAARRVKEVN